MAGNLGVPLRLLFACRIALKSLSLYRRGPWASCVVVVLLTATSIHAQPWPANGNPYYRQAYPHPSSVPPIYYGYPQGYQQPTWRAPSPNAYYGNSPYTAPAFADPRWNYVPTTYPSPKNGTYYYPPNLPRSNPEPQLLPSGQPPTSRLTARAPTAPPAAPQAQLPEIPGREGELLPEETGASVSRRSPLDDRFWLKANYLSSIIRPMRFAGPLATMGSTLDDAPGAIGQPSTGVIFGNDSVDYGLISGVRLEAGLYLDANKRFSADFGGFWLFPNSQSYSLGADLGGNPQISRPFFNFASGREAAVQNSTTGALSGSIQITNQAAMAGLELNARYHVRGREGFQVDGLCGFRYVRLAEQLCIQEQINPLQDFFLTYQQQFVNAPDSLAVEDNFRTVNQFLGPQIGARISWESGPLTLDGFAKLAIGASRQQTTIEGATTLVSPNGNQITPAGLLALQSNSGSHHQTVVGVIPELGVNLGLNLTPHIRLQMGYSLLLWNQVVRPGNQFDRTIDPIQIPGNPAFGTSTGPPTHRFNDEFFWSHTFNIGLGINY